MNIKSEIVTHIATVHGDTFALTCFSARSKANYVKNYQVSNGDILAVQIGRRRDEGRSNRVFLEHGKALQLLQQ